MRIEPVATWGAPAWLCFPVRRRTRPARSKGNKTWKGALLLKTGLRHRTVRAGIPEAKKKGHPKVAFFKHSPASAYQPKLVSLVLSFSASLQSRFASERYSLWVVSADCRSQPCSWCLNRRLYPDGSSLTANALDGSQAICLALARSNPLAQVVG